MPNGKRFAKTLENLNLKFKPMKQLAVSKPSEVLLKEVQSICTTFITSQSYETIPLNSKNNKMLAKVKSS